MNKIGKLNSNNTDYDLGGESIKGSPVMLNSPILISSSSATSLASGSYHTVQITTSHISNYKSSFAYELYLSCACTVSTDEKTGYLAISPGSANSENGRVNVGGAIARTSAGYNAAHTVTVVLPANISYLSFYNSGSGTITYAVYLIGYRRMGTNTIESTVSNRIQKIQTSLGTYDIGGKTYDIAIEHEKSAYPVNTIQYINSSYACTEVYLISYGDYTNPDASNFPTPGTSVPGYLEGREPSIGGEGFSQNTITLSLAANSASSFQLANKNQYINMVQNYRTQNLLKRQNSFTQAVEGYINARISHFSTAKVLLHITGYSATPSGSGSCIVKIASGNKTYAQVDALNTYLMRTEYHSTSTYMCAGNIQLIDDTGYLTVANCSSNTISVTLRYHDAFFIGTGNFNTSLSPSVGCVTANTLIQMANNMYKEAKDIQVGDLINTYNEDTKQFEINPVLAIKESKKDDIIKVAFIDGSSIELTSGHPFLIEKGWASYDNEKTRKENLYNGAKLYQLEPGDKCLNQNGEYVTIISIQYLDTDFVDVYDFTIDKAHTFIGNGKVLHNVATGGSTVIY